MKPWTLTMEVERLKMESLRVCRPVVADSHHFDEEQDPDPHLSEKLDPDLYESDPDPQPWVKNTKSRKIKAILVNDDLNPKNERYGSFCTVTKVYR
jgi:hypothetical protein